MGPKLLIDTLVRIIPTGQPTFLTGAPGIGKSDCIREVARRLKCNLIDIRAVLFDPVDLRGIPTVRDGKAHWCPPDFLPSASDGEGILFLDELPQAAPLVQASLLQLTLDRRIGEYNLPDGWHIVAAGNRVEDRAGGHRIISPLLNRFLHLDVEADLSDWQEWAIRNNIAPEVRTFLGWRPKLLHDFDPSKQQRAFPSPRSWAFLSRVLPTCNTENMHAVAAGCVGDAAAEFTGYLRTFRSLPDIDKLLANPTSATIPDQADVLWSLCGALSERARAKDDKKTLSAIVKVALRLSDSGDKEFSALLMRDCKVASDGAIWNVPEANKWLADNSQLIVNASKTS